MYIDIMKETLSSVVLSLVLFLLSACIVPVLGQAGNSAGAASENARDQRWVKQGPDILHSYPVNTRIGIGTDSPLLPFEVAGQSRFHSGVAFDSEALFGSEILFELGALTSAGNLGLGTRTPSNRLEVVGSSLFDGNSSFLRDLQVGENLNILGGAEVRQDALFRQNLSVEADFTLGGSAEISEEMKVSGPARFAGEVAFANGHWSSDGRLVVGRSTAVENYTFQVKGSADAEELFLDGIPIKEAVAVWRSPAGQHSDIVYNDGNVGIGTLDPDPRYRLSVNGRMRSKEVVVESGWADFVFESGYQLRTLEELEDFIARYGHLPGIPSAEEVKINGVALGEMQKLLLQKVEELVLYTIQQQKQIEELRQMLEKMDKTIPEHRRP